MLRATRKSLFVRKTFTLAPPKVDVSFNLHTTAGVSYKGKPCATSLSSDSSRQYHSFSVGTHDTYMLCSCKSMICFPSACY